MSKELENAESFLKWLQTKAYLNAMAESAAKRFVKRGQVYWCHFGINVGSEISKTTPRPAIVVSNFQTNKGSSNVLVIPVTHRKIDSLYLVPITPVIDDDGKVLLDGKADIASVTCVSKARFTDQITTLSAAQMREIDRGLSISLGLSKYYTAKVNDLSLANQHIEQLKAERDFSQNLLTQIQNIVAEDNVEQVQEQIKKLLDI